MDEHLPGTPLLPEQDERRHDRKRHCRDRQELEQPGIDSGDKPAHGINGAAMQKSQNGSQRQRTEPPEELFVRGFQG